MQKMGGLRTKLRTTYWTFLIATLAISGVPGLSGFFSKDEILLGAFEGPLGKPWIFWLATLTAGLTAFYMFRGVFLTFHGTSRVTPEVEHHVHESGRKMTTPLIVLAVFSVIVGYVNLPGTPWFVRYLEPVFGPAESLLTATAPAHAAEGHPGLLVMGASLLVVAVGILLAYWLYLKSPELPRQLAERFRLAYQVLINKYYVDEIYNWLIVRPICWGSDKVLWRAFDAGAIDHLMVEGTANATARVGNILRRMQSGYVRSYAAWVLLGAVLWLAYVLLLT
jgi:NADH-quinone oxidoreductase subunit L